MPHAKSHTFLDPLRRLEPPRQRAARRSSQITQKHIQQPAGGTTLSLCPFPAESSLSLRIIKETANPKPFLTLSAVSSRRDSERLGGAVEHTQTPEKCASLLSTKNQNGLRNQFHLSPYKPLTAQCESAPQPTFYKKSKA